MEGSASLERDRTRTLLDTVQVGGDRRADPPYDRGGMKYAQAVISQTTDGKWKITVQSDRQVETMLIGEFEDIIKELKFAATRDWEKRS
jgi:hypothetical protein